MVGSLGDDVENAIHASETVDGGRGVLDELNGIDIDGTHSVERRHLYTVDYVERLGAGVYRGGTAPCTTDMRTDISIYVGIVCLIVLVQTEYEENLVCWDSLFMPPSTVGSYLEGASPANRCEELHAVHISAQRSRKSSFFMLFL